jgi:hypothetical protein
MGMFDYFRSSYDLGEVFTDTCCHTKDIDDFSSGSMAQYWLSPDGQLYLIDYSHTANFVELKEGDEGFHPERKLRFLNFQWIPNGERGKVRPTSLTKYITVYPERFDGEWQDLPKCHLHFKQGKLQDYEHLSKGEWI